jgi:N-acetylneuraminate synthase/sialic acid synthase
VSEGPRRRAFEIDGKVIDDSSACYVVAEIGHNHQGDVEQAKRMFAEAKECGADAVKLQKRDNRSLFTRDYYGRPYDNPNSFGTSYGEHREALEFERSEYLELQAYANEIGITFFATAFDAPSCALLAELDMPAFKVASGDLKNTPLLRCIAETGRPVIMSTGAAVLEDVLRAYNTIAEVNPNVAVLQCTASYPPAWEELDLTVITTYRELFPASVIGFSSHDSGIAMAVAAYVLGGRIVEKHFTLNRAMRGTDHAFSLEPQGLSKMVRDLRRARVALGDGTKRMYSCEVEPSVKMAKKLVTTRALPGGHVLSFDDITAKSPGDGLPPYELDNLVGRALRQPVDEETTLTFELLEETVPDIASSAYSPVDVS